MTAESPLNRAITACARCRGRKTKCDRNFPSCGSCSKAGVICEALDPATGRNIPRSYVAHLEEQIAELQQRNQELREAAATASPRQPRGDGSDAGSATDSSNQQLSFAKMMFTAVSTTGQVNSLETPLRQTVVPAQLPSYDEMMRLRHIYFNHSNPQVPILTYDGFDQYMRVVYQGAGGGVSGMSLGNHSGHDSSAAMADSAEQARATRYFIHIVAAIALGKDPSNEYASQHHAAALNYLPLVFAGPRLSSLTAVLLLSLYAMQRQSSPGVWYTLGIASRLITDLELQSFVPTPEDDGAEIRRLFWSWYVLDRQVCTYLSRPTSIADNVIHCPMPADLEPTQLAFCQLRVLQSEIQRILHHADTLPRVWPTLEAWRGDMQIRLDAWEASRPRTSEQGGSEFDPLFITLNYHQTVLLLQGFSANLPPNPLVMLPAARACLHIYRDLWQADAVNFIWLAVHNTFVAGSSFCYGLLYMPGHQLLGEVLAQLDEVTEVTRTMLEGMCVRCPATADVLAQFDGIAAEVRRKAISRDEHHQQQQQRRAASAATIDLSPRFANSMLLRTPSAGTSPRRMLVNDTSANPYHQQNNSTGPPSRDSLDIDFNDLINGHGTKALWADFFAGSNDLMWGQAPGQSTSAAPTPAPHHTQQGS
ncbi:Fungal specific transcription factor [Savitreella phatthalungensis]